MMLFDYELKVVEGDDEKKKHNSYEIELLGMDNAIPTWVAGYGWNKETSDKEFKEALNDLLSRLDEVRGKVKEIYDTY